MGSLPKVSISWVGEIGVPFDITHPLEILYSISASKSRKGPDERSVMPSKPRLLAGTCNRNYLDTLIYLAYHTFVHPTNKNTFDCLCIVHIRLNEETPRGEPGALHEPSGVVHVLSIAGKAQVNHAIIRVY